MPPFKNVYKAVRSSLFVHKSTIVSDRPIKKADENKEQLAAQQLIHKLPKSAKECLTLADLYKQQGDLQSALQVYYQALQQCLPEEKGGAGSCDDYQRLEREKQSVLVMLNEQRHGPGQGFVRMLPYDILCLIFEKLSIRDLLRCAAASRSWSNFLVDWPDFWQKIALEMPQMQKSVLDGLLQRHTKKLQLGAPMDIDLIYDLLVFIAGSEIPFLRSLSFHSLRLEDDDVTRLLNVLKLAARNIKHIQFIDVTMPSQHTISFLKSCSTATSITFSQSFDAPYDTFYGYEYPPASKKQIIRPKITFSSLTYLQLSFGYPDAILGRVGEQTGQLTGVLLQCPNLEQLFIDSRISLNHGYCVNQAVKHCPRLTNVVVSEKTEKPVVRMNSNSGTSSDSYEQISDTVATISHAKATDKKEKTKPGAQMKGLVLGGTQVRLDQDIGSSIFKLTHKSLETLHLFCTLERSRGRKAFYKLASLGAPNLRELNLGFLSKGGSLAEFTKVMSSLFSQCPALEVLRIWKPKYYVYGNCLAVNDDVLKTIANSCTLLTQLFLIGEQNHTVDGVLHFASSRLTDLEIDIPRDKVLDVIENIKTLQRLHVRNDYRGFSNRSYWMPTQYKEIAETILRERGGSLVLD